MEKNTLLDEVADRLEKFRIETNMNDVGVRNGIDNAAKFVRSMKYETTASQPKSIGDDAQFLDLLRDHAYSYDPEHRYTEKEKIEIDRKLIAFIDNFRAPAAQASATIQVAPRVPTEEMQHAARDWSVKKYGIGIGKDAAIGCWQAMWDAATIQEPVMVADRWQEAVKEACIAACIDWTGDPQKILSTLVEWHVEMALDPAVSDHASMVADPAGVAGDDAAKAMHWFSCLDECAKLLGLPDDEPIPSGVVKAVRNLAATVKGIPKIRITLRQARHLVDFFGGHDADVTVTERPAVWEQVEEGLYAFCTEYPEDGAQFLGATEVGDELMRLGSVKAVPSEAPEDLLNALCAMVLENDAGGVTLATSGEARNVIEKYTAPLADKTGGGA